LAMDIMDGERPARGAWRDPDRRGHRLRWHERL